MKTRILGGGFIFRTQFRVRIPSIVTRGGAWLRGALRTPKVLLAGIAGLILTSTPAFADPVASGTFQDMMVLGDLDVSGSNFTLGTAVVNGTAREGVALTYAPGASGTAATLKWIAPQEAHQWIWERSSTNGIFPAMMLDGSNCLSLYSSGSDHSPMIFLNPNSGSAGSLISGFVRIDSLETAILTCTNSFVAQGTNNRLPNQVLSDYSSILTRQLGDARYLTPQAAGALYVPQSANSLAVTFGGRTSTAGNCGIALGDGVQALGTEAVAIGDHSSAGGDHAFALGLNAIASNRDAFSLGDGTVASGVAAFAMGSGAAAADYSSIAIGLAITASKPGSVAIGRWSTSSGYDAVVLGLGSTASGDYSAAIGHQADASGTNSFAFGSYPEAWGESSTAIGSHNTALGDFSQAFGVNASSEFYAQTVVGQFNVIRYQWWDQYPSRHAWYPEDELFTIGNGTDQGHPSNAFIVRKNGNTLINGKLTISGSAGGIVVTGGTMNAQGVVAVSGTAHLVLIPQQGDLPMGIFHSGPLPQ